jgi:hypothetical protein
VSKYTTAQSRLVLRPSFPNCRFRANRRAACSQRRLVRRVRTGTQLRCARSVHLWICLGLRRDLFWQECGHDRGVDGEYPSIGLSSALGSLVPLFMKGGIHFRTKEIVLFAGVIALLVGVGICGTAGRIRDGHQQTQGRSWRGIFLRSVPG